MTGRITRPDRLEIAYFAQHQLDELAPERQHLRPSAPAHARCAGGQGAGARRGHRVSGRQGRHPGRAALGRRAGAAPARARHHGGRPSHRARRADQPSRHRQPRRPHHRHQRLSGRRDAGVARPLPASKPAPTGCGWWQTGRSRRSTAISTNTATRCWPSVAAARAPSGPARAPRRRAAAARSGGRPPRSASSSRRCGGASRRPRARSNATARRSRRIDAALAEPGLFARDPGRAAVLAKGRAEAASALARAEDDWLEASAAFEAAMS